MTISRMPTGGRGRQGPVVAPSQATRARWSLVERCSKRGSPSWPRRSPRKRGHRALLDGAATGSGLRSSNYGKKERTACTIGSATRCSPEAGRSSGYRHDNLGRRVVGVRSDRPRQVVSGESSLWILSEMQSAQARSHCPSIVHLFLDIGWHEVDRPDDHSLLNWINSTCNHSKDEADRSLRVAPVVHQMVGEIAAVP
jgi:hypothetical protein